MEKPSSRGGSWGIANGVGVSARGMTRGGVAVEGVGSGGSAMVEIRYWRYGPLRGAPQAIALFYRFVGMFILNLSDVIRCQVSANLPRTE